MDTLQPVSVGTLPLPMQELAIVEDLLFLMMVRALLKIKKMKCLSLNLLEGVLLGLNLQKFYSMAFLVFKQYVEPILSHLLMGVAFDKPICLNLF